MEWQFAERASALTQLGKLREATEHLRRGLELFPESEALWAELAWVHFKGEEPQEARYASEQAIMRNPESLLALQVLANLEIDAGDSGKAHDLADRLLLIMPESPTIHLTKVRAFTSEENGAWRHRDLVRQGVMFAVSVAPEDSGVLRSAAVVLEPIAPKEEIIGLVERGLAISPLDVDLQLLLVELRSKSDVQTVRGWTQVLARDPMNPRVSLGVHMMVWERTRLLSAFALWTVPAMVVPVFALIVLGLGLRNAWDLCVGMSRALPRGALRRIWSAPRWAIGGVVLCFVGPVWPALVVGVVMTGQLWLLPIIPCALLLGESIVVKATHRSELAGLARLSRREASEMVEQFASHAQYGLVRVVLGGCGLLATGAFGAFAFNERGFSVLFPAILLFVSAAFAVPPLMVFRQVRKLKRLYPKGTAHQLSVEAG